MACVTSGCLCGDSRLGCPGERSEALRAPQVQMSRQTAGVKTAETFERNQPKRILGAIEGTRTPTPLPVHGPEPCASANSATMAI
jgi:hypothetical protein